MTLRQLSQLLSLAFALTAAAPVQSAWQHLGDVTAHSLDGPVVNITCGVAHVQVVAQSQHVVRIRLAPDGTFARDFSWAVQNASPQAVFELAASDDDTVTYSTGGLNVRVGLRPCRITVMDAEGNVLVADDPARGLSWQVAGAGDVAPVRVWQQFSDDTRVFGLGEKAGGMHRGDRTWVNWNTDAPGYTRTTDPLYVTVPFFIAVREQRYHGVFFDNTWRSSFDFDRLARNLMSFGAEGGALDYYVIAGPHPRDVIERYTNLTGRIALPPRWAIGYHQCRYSYFPDERVREVARTFREKRIPCDVLYFDIDYMDEYRCFTWNNERFPDPREMMNDLNSQGFRTVAIIDPGIKNEPGYPVFDTGARIDAWVKRPEGEPYVGRVWPGDCVFPDFTADRVRDWWAGLFPPFIAASGLDGVWNDMNEPADFANPSKTVPLELRHDYGGSPASHRAAHNVYGMQMARATRDGLQRARPDQRPFTLTRASYAGGQRDAAIWTGDNISNWDHFAMSVPMALSCGISGMPFVGPDIGGFIGGATPELYARWIQVGALFPYARTHTSCNNPDQEPWSFGPRVEAIARTALERRYAWMPYIYTLFEEASRTGAPIIRPIWYEQPGYDGWSLDSVFYLGPDILVAPKLTPGEEPYSINLPEGVWFEGNTGEIYGGNRWYQMPGDLETLVHFFRAGAIVPMQSPVQHTGETPAEPLIIDVWPWGDSKATLYRDDGSSFAYQQEAFQRTEFRCESRASHIMFAVEAIDGQFDAGPDYPHFPLLRLHGISRPPLRIDVNNANYAWRAKEATDSADPTLPDIRTYHYDPDTRTVLVRLAAPLDPETYVQLVRGRRVEGEVHPVVLAFDGTGHKLTRPRGASAVEYVNEAARFTMRWGGTARVLLPRLKVSADALPVMELRAATEHARKAIVRFSTEEDPQAVVETAALDLIPDGKLQVFRVNMPDMAGEKWRGTVYWMELEFTENIRGNETITLAQIGFRPAD